MTVKPTTQLRSTNTLALAHTHTNSHSISQWNCNSLWPGMQCRPQVSEVTFALDRTEQNVINIDAFCQQARGRVECGKARRWTEQLPPRVWHGLLKRKRLFTMCNKLALLGDAQSPILAWHGLGQRMQTEWQTNNKRATTTTTARRGQRLWLKLIK